MRCAAPPDTAPDSLSTCGAACCAFVSSIVAVLYAACLEAHACSCWQHPDAARCSWQQQHLRASACCCCCCGGPPCVITSAIKRCWPASMSLRVALSVCAILCR